MVEIDVSDVVQFDRDAARAHRKFANQLLGVLKRAAREERSSHAYQNRTHNLENSTQAVIVGEGTDSITIDLTMGEDYASYVVARGFSNIEEIEARAEQSISSIVGEMMQKVGG